MSNVGQKNDSLEPVQQASLAGPSSADPLSEGSLSDPLSDPLAGSTMFYGGKPGVEVGGDGPPDSGSPSDAPSSSVQFKGQKRMSPGQVQETASKGVSGSGGSMPHLGKIQQSFGGHDVSGVKAHVGGAAGQASRAMGAKAYATGSSVAFKSTPDLHTAAHEAAHVVQQRSGVNLAGGVGKRGDSYERHANAVADRVVAGKSAEGMLGGSSSGGGGGASAVQNAPDDQVQYSPDTGMRNAWPSSQPATGQIQMKEEETAAVMYAAESSTSDATSPVQAAFTSAVVQAAGIDEWGSGE